MIASRMYGLDSSGIRKVFDLAQKMKKPVNLSIGQPDFDVPEAIKKEAVNAINSGANRYTMTQGIPELRERCLHHAQKTYGILSDNIMITCGVSGGAALAFLVLVNPGDEILIPDPYFGMYKYLTKLCGGTPKFISTYPDFKLTAEHILAQITPQSKILILNSPANPTGAICNSGEIRDIVEVARKHDLIIISDEIYRDYIYDEHFESIGKFYEKTVTLGGFSKSHAVTGWRIGFAIGPAEIISEMIKLQQYTFVCAPSFAQVAISKTIDHDIDEHIKGYKRKRDLIYDKLKGLYNVTRPKGAFYLFPQVSWGTGQEFVTEAIKRNLLIIPGSVFSEQDTHFRISYAASDEAIEKGIEILIGLAKNKQ